MDSKNQLEKRNADFIKTMEIREIKPYPKNAKKHPQKQIDLIAESIKKFGFDSPIIIDKNNEIIAGHGRYLAAKQLGLEEVPTISKETLTDEEVKAYRLADNKISESEWDMGLAVDELKELSAELFDLTGFDKDLLIEPDEKDDIIPENPPAISELGDLYELGKHRVLCGDSTKIEDVERLMDGKKADMVFQSPPYNVGHNLGYKGKKSKYENSDDNLSDYRDLIIKSTKLAILNATDVFINLQFLANNKKDLVLFLAELVDNFKDIFFWKKLQVQPAMAMNVANSQTEVILLFGKDNTSRSWGNKRFRGTFSNHLETRSASGENKNTKIHNATFPVALPTQFILTGYIENSIVADFFMGCGSTLIASEKTGRICYGMEIDPKYIDVIIQRYVDYTGNEEIKKNGEKILWPMTKKS